MLRYNLRAVCELLFSIFFPLYFILGLRSLSLPLISCDLDIECTLKQLRSKRNSNLLRECPVETMAKRHLVALRDYYLQNTYTSPSCLWLPDVMVAQYEIKSSTIQMLPFFLGLDNPDPYEHLEKFLKVCSTIKLNGFSKDALKMRLFPFSLKEQAKHWFNSLGSSAITSWVRMQHEFLKKYFPIGKTNDYRRAMMGFSQYDGEQFYENWERLNENRGVNVLRLSELSLFGLDSFKFYSSSSSSRAHGRANKLSPSSSS
jgi:hypothetical protein